VKAARFEETLRQWIADPVSFMDSLVDPETDEPFCLYQEEKTFVREAFTLRTDGTLPYAEVVFSAPKKSGKTALGALCGLYVVFVLGGRYAEGYCVANDLDQAEGRVFHAMVRILEASDIFSGSYYKTSQQILFPATGATITAIAADYAGAAGANPTITVFDELWGYTSERSHRLWDEMVPPPTRRVACRLTVTYAGFEGESTVLEGLHNSGKQGKEIAPDLRANGPLLMYWTHELRAPWQSEAWRNQMRTQLRPNAYLRMVENRWVTSESSFVDIEWWDACVDRQATPVVSDPSLDVWLGVDASIKHDSAAVVACSFDRKVRKVRLVAHRVFQPSPNDPLDLEDTLEATVLDFHGRFRVRETRYDPYQFHRSATTLTKSGVKMVEFPQSVPNLTEASQNLYELIKGRNILAYPDADIRLSVQRAVALESSRGWRITKEKSAHKIDVVVSLAQAALGAVQQGNRSTQFRIGRAGLTAEEMRARPPREAELAEIRRKAQVIWSGGRF
jgi:phage terminase large subunit-like protein